MTGDHLQAFLTCVCQRYIDAVIGVLFMRLRHTTAASG